MSEFEAKLKSQHGALAFMEMSDGSVWQVGVIPRCHIDDIDRESLGKYNTYTMYRSKKLGIGYIDSFDIVNSEVELIDGVSAVLYGILVSEKLLPLGQVNLLCYKIWDGIESFPSESEEEK